MTTPFRRVVDTVEWMTAVVTMSVELELGWGVHDLDEHADHLTEDGREERRFLRRLLDVCDETGVAMTFDVVDHLLLTACDGHHDGPYPEGWFDADPGTDVAVDPLFYAPDVVEAIRDRPTEHELCTHSFSHTPLETVDAAAVSADLERGQQLEADVLGQRSRSFVPPRHRPPPSDVLVDRGIDVVRIAIMNQADNPVRRAGQLLFGPPPMRDPEWIDGVLWTYCSTHPNLTAPSLPSGQRPAGRPLGWLPTGLAQRLHLQYLERATLRAIENDEHLHLWCHLYDLSNERQMAPVSEYLQTLARLREQGRVEVCTMDELPDRYPAAVESSAPPGE
ncbi:polysaccharide deacetylase family protein [Natronoarchaeum rubrum]|uniref:polysaccharide deacetylase family protein n=1 Tax=Natronoarchaeum rubrum TaxID=755311 RepID=UPI0021127617|nr:polysaccharide deacetylase family protein [Natronoarchaeum rubrum]